MTQKTTKQIDQSFKSHPSFPQLELRSTYNSKQAYKAHSHSEFSIGAIERGTTQIQYAGKSHLANEGQLVLIEPHKVHSCNPYGGQQRSYQMLYIDNQWYQNKLTSL
ncbi:MAG: AraC family ligand binding domain-containing protein, partial [Kangiellaceae bacterium]|nr:AraC family ligand binding domain-containing protein [Kangiellaceae bacterium]